MERLRKTLGSYKDFGKTFHEAFISYTVTLSRSLAKKPPTSMPIGIQGHAVAETPTGVAHALLYIVRASPSFLLHRSFQSFYHTFHQCDPHHLLRERPLAVNVLRMARYSPSDGHQGTHAYYLAAALRPIEIDHCERVPRAVWYANDNDWDYCGMPAPRRRSRFATASVATGHRNWPS